MTEGFFQVHRGLDRQGPGEAADVHWALSHIPAPTRVLDAACGPGADMVTFAEALPEAEIVGADLYFADEARERTSRFGARVSASGDDMFKVQGPFDFIWCAGAAYFAGVTESLTRFKTQLAPGGHVAFSEPIAPGADARQAARDFWKDYPALTDREGVEAHIAAAGYETLGTRRICGAPWQAYYAPMQARIDALRPGAAEGLIEALDEAQREIDLWRAAQDHIVYVLFLVRPNGA